LEGIGTIMATSLKSLKANSFTPVIVSAGVSSSVKVTSVTPSVDVPAGGQTLTVTGSGFNSGAVVYVDSNTCSTTYVSSTSLTFTSPAKSLGAYHLYVYNTDGSVGIKPNGITYSTAPSWVTSSGSLFNAGVGTSYTQSVSATSDSTITYSLTSGSLPSGLNLISANGAITGTPSTSGTSTFTITATDAEGQTASRSFSIAAADSPTSINYLLVAGGGAGGAYGAGGGAGGLLTNDLSISSDVIYTVTIGSGGTSTTSSTTSGANSSISGSGITTLTGIGGGAGGRSPFQNAQGANGGSGGGSGTADNNVVTGGLGTAGPPRQGYNGGSFNGGANYYAGGGGGAGAVGYDNDAPSNNQGKGGIGVTSSITGTSTYYAGGGGGGGFNGLSYGGLGGGGRGGGSTETFTGTAGSINTGGGGGGGGYSGGVIAGGSGGSGIVVIRYADTYPDAVVTGSPTFTTTGGYKIYKFTSSGSITF